MIKENEQLTKEEVLKYREGGGYIIGPYDAYYTFPESGTVPLRTFDIPFPKWITTINPDNITSKTMMLNAVTVSGMLERIFDESLMVKTANGRKKTTPFHYKIRNTTTGNCDTLLANKPPIRIDAIFESSDNFYLFEAKNTLVDNFLIRQLYFPYRHWFDKIDKDITPVFLQHKKGRFLFSVFTFDNPLNYNSIRLVEQIECRLTYS